MFGNREISRRAFLREGGVFLASASIAGCLLNTEGLLKPSSAMAVEEFLSEKDLALLLSIGMSKGGDFAEIYFEDSSEKNIQLQEKKIRSTQIGYLKGIGIRVLSGDKIGYAYSDELTMDKLKEAAEVASNIAGGKGADKAYSVTPHSVPSYYSINIYPEDVEISKKLNLLQKANEYAYSLDKRVKSVRLGYHEKAKNIMIATTDGAKFKDKQNHLLFWIQVVVEDGSKKESCFYGDGGCVGFEFFDKIKPEDIVKVAVERTLINLDAKEAPAGTMEVVIGGMYGGVLLHEAIGHGLEADLNKNNLSAYSGKLGQKIAPDNINIYDDATINPKQSGTINIDDEGQEGRRTVLVENGVLKNYMQDRLNAKAMNMDFTGNGRRENFRFAPVPRMTNTIMGNGNYSTEEIISSVKKGFYAKAMTNGQVEIASGNFMFYVDQGYMIEDGKVTTPVKGATLIGNGPDVLSKINMVANDFSLAPCYFQCGKNGQSVPVGFGMPTIKVSELTVGGTHV